MLQKAIDRIEPVQSIEVAMKALSKTPDIPGALRQLLGTDNVRAIAALVTSGIVLEVDTLEAAGVMDEIEATQYIHLIPEFTGITNRSYEIEHAVFNYVKPTLVRRFRNQMRPTAKKEDKFDYVLNSLHAFLNLFPSADQGWRKFLFGEMYNNISAFIFQYVYQALDDPTERRAYVDYCQAINTQYSRAYHVSLPGVNILDEYSYYRHTLQQPHYVENLDRLVAPTRNNEAQTPTEDSFQTNLARLRKLKEYRAIYPTQNRIAGAIVAFYRDELFGPSSIYQGICELQIALDSCIPVEQYQVCISKSGVRSYLLAIRRGVFSVKLNINGEIVFSCNTAETLESLLGKERYFLLKYKVVALLINYLEGKEEDIPDLFAKANIVPAAVRDAVRETVEAVDDEVATGNMTRELPTTVVPPIEATTDEDTQSETSVVDEAFEPQLISQPKEPAKKKLSKMPRSLKGEQVYRALTRLLGEPRVHSSHFIFTGRNGRTFPIPIHFGRDIHSPILTKCLEVWEISPAEFVLAL